MVKWYWDPAEPAGFPGILQIEAGKLVEKGPVRRLSLLISPEGQILLFLSLIIPLTLQRHLWSCAVPVLCKQREGQHCQTEPCSPRKF